MTCDYRFLYLDSIDIDACKLHQTSPQAIPKLLCETLVTWGKNLGVVFHEVNIVFL